MGIKACASIVGTAYSLRPGVTAPRACPGVTVDSRGGSTFGMGACNGCRRLWPNGIGRSGKGSSEVVG